MKPNHGLSVQCLQKRYSLTVCLTSLVQYSQSCDVLVIGLYGLGTGQFQVVGQSGVVHIKSSLRPSIFISLQIKIHKLHIWTISPARTNSRTILFRQIFKELCPFNMQTKCENVIGQKPTKYIHMLEQLLYSLFYFRKALHNNRS